MLTESETLKAGDIYIRRTIVKATTPYERNTKSVLRSFDRQDSFEIGVWNGDSVPVTLDELRQLRKFINDTIIKVTYKTK